MLCLLYDSKSDLLDCKKLYLLVILLLLFSMTHSAHANRQLQRFVSSISLYFVTFYEFRYVSFYVIEKGFCYRWRAILVVPVFNLTYLCLLTDSEINKTHHCTCLKSVFVGLGRRRLADVAQKSRLLGNSALYIVSKQNDSSK